MVDQDQPQLKLGDVDANDPQALRDPRPDKELVQSRGLAVLEPVGGGVTQLGSRTVGLDIVAEVGVVTVETD